MTRPGLKRLNMASVVAEALRLLEPSLKPGVRVHAELESEGTILLGNPDQLHQLVLELCLNAFEAMDSGGKLTVRLEAVELSAELARAYPPLREGHHVRLEVEDTGSGVDPAVASPGTGLGLVVVQSIARAHGGVVAVSSVAGEGTTVEVFLPSGGQARQDQEGERAQPGPGG